MCDERNETGGKAGEHSGSWQRSMNYLVAGELQWLDLRGEIPYCQDTNKDVKQWDFN